MAVPLRVGFTGETRQFAEIFFKDPFCRKMNERKKERKKERLGAAPLFGATLQPVAMMNSGESSCRNPSLTLRVDVHGENRKDIWPNRRRLVGRQTV